MAKVTQSRPRVNIPARDAPHSERYEAQFLPLSGLSTIDPVKAGPNTLLFGHFASSQSFNSQNVWIENGHVRPRDRLKPMFVMNGANDKFGEGSGLGVNGAISYWDISGGHYTVVTSDRSVYIMGSDKTYNLLAYQSHQSNERPSGSYKQKFYGDTIYYPKRDLNLCVFTNGVNPIYCTAAPTDGMNFSILTEAPIAADVAAFENRVLAWNIQESSQATRWVTRVQWTTNTSPTDWTGIGSGWEDLVDMRGIGTRIFSDEDEVILFSNQEIWRGRPVGYPFILQFTPITKQLGLPFPNCAIQTPVGIFWLANDMHIYRLYGSQIDTIDGPIHHELKRTLERPDVAFMTYDREANRLDLFYKRTRPSASDGAGLSCSDMLSFHVDEKVWTYSNFDYLTFSWGAETANADSGNTRWNTAGLTQTADGEYWTWNDYLGKSTRLRNNLQSVVFLAKQVTAGATADSIDSGQPYVFDDSANTELSSSSQLADCTKRLSMALFTEDMRHQKYLDEVRLDWGTGPSPDGTAFQPSTVSMYIADGFGNTASGTNPASRETLAISLTGSNNVLTTAHTPGSLGTYFQITLESVNSSNWKLYRAYAKADSEGRP